MPTGLYSTDGGEKIKPMIAENSTIIGNGMPKKKMPANAKPATYLCTRPIKARLVTFTRASITTTRTAALIR